MKRALFESVKVNAYSSGSVIDRDGFLSAILAAKLTSISGSPTGAKLTVAITECDTENGTFTSCADSLALVGGSEFEVDMTASTPSLEVNIPVDLIGCKRYIKLTGTITYTGGTTPSCTAAYAVALGDKDVVPAK